MLLLLLSIFCIWFTLVAIAPLNKLKELNEQVESDSVFTAQFDSTYYRNEMTRLVKEKVYKEALLQLAENDSIQLVINLTDSTVNLSINGVIIHQVVIDEFRKDKLFDKLLLSQEVWLLSKPLSVDSIFSTVVKEPVVVREAPKDTLEAALNAWQPDTLIQKPAFVAFSVENNIQIIFEQEFQGKSNSKQERNMFYYHLYSKQILSSFKNFIHLKKQEYSPTISITMPSDEIQAIYRALPEHTYVVLKL